MEKTTTTKPSNISEYFATFPQATQEALEQIRKTIHKAAPEAEEVISYNMASFNLHGAVLVYFGGFKKHIGFYPRVSAINAFHQELSGYKGQKGSVQFPLDQPMPLELITKIVKFRAQENLERSLSGKK